MKKTRLLLLTMLLSLTGVLEVSAQEAYCALEKEKSNNGDLKEVIATFYYDNQRSSRGETVDVADEDYGKVAIPIADYVHVVFDQSFANYRPHKTCYWFNWLQARVKVSFSGWENLNTSELTSTSYMFYALGKYEDGDEIKTCEVENLDLTHFDTSHVTDMTNMFCYVSSVDVLDISSFTINPGCQTEEMMGQSDYQTIILPATANNLSNTAFFYTPSQGYCNLIYPDGFVPGNQVVNGDCESNDVTSLWGRDGAIENVEDFMNGANTHFVDGAGYNGSRGIKVVSIEDAAASYSTMFFIYTPDYVWQTGDKYHFKMRVRADKAASITAQAHITPTAYLTYDLLDPMYDVTMEWQEIDYEGEITKSQNGMQTIVFLLNESREANNYYFDDISWVPFYINSDGIKCINWKGGNFKYAFLLGDANGDGTVSVADVMMTVDYVLGLNPEGFKYDNANVVNDKTISVTDVMAIVDIVLGLNTNHAQASSRNQ